MTDSRQTPFVGVILVNWNTADLTLDCVASLKRGARTPDEILVIDNASCPEDRSKLDHLNGITRINLPENTGFTGANNRGIRFFLEKGADFIWILNNDTLVDPACLHHLLAHLHSRPGTIAVTGKIYFSEPPNRIWFAGGRMRRLTATSRHIGVNEEDHGQFEQPEPITFICGCCMLVRASALERVGGFHPDYFAYCEDTEWSLRARARGYQLGYEPAARLWHRVGASLLNRKPKTAIGEEAETLLLRNWTYTIRLHAHWWQKPFACASLLRYSLKRICLALLRGQHKGAANIYKALREGATLQLRMADGNVPCR